MDVPEPVQFGKYAAQHLETINWRGYEIKAQCIALYIKTLERWGQSERAEYIR